MSDWELSAQDFEVHRDYLHEIALRILGSADEAADAVEETWQRLNRGDSSVEENATAWLNAVMTRICVDILRTRKRKRVDAREPYDADALESATLTISAEQETAIAESVGVALLAALEWLSPPERLALVLHDVFAVPIDEIADIVGHSPDDTRRLYGRARRRVHRVDVRGEAVEGHGDPEPAT